MTFEKTFTLTLSFLAMMFLLRGTAMAGVNGSMELINSTGEAKTTDSTGLSTKAKTGDFLQRYRLGYEDTIYPYVSVRGGVLFDEEVLTSRGGDTDQKTTIVRIAPNASLNLTNPFIRAGAGYDMSEVSTSDLITKNIRETKNAFLGFRPEGLPPLQMQYQQAHFFDKKRVELDQESTTLTFNTGYSPVKDLDVRYQAARSTNEDLLRFTTSESLSQTGRMAYGSRFLNNRAGLTTSYTLNRVDFENTSSGSGIRVPLFPVAGLSGITDTSASGALTQNPALIDGNIVASSGLNIGRIPSLGGDTRERNMGLDFGLETEVNILSVWVDRELPAAVAGSFSWDIYVSADNQTWTLRQTVFPAAFSPFENRFEIGFATVKTRYIKAVTRPLSTAVSVPLGVDVSNISITELQALIDKPAEQIVGTNSITSQRGDVGVSVNIVSTDRQSVVYDTFFGSSRSSFQPSSRYVFSNALTASRKLSRAVSGNARVQRENQQNADGSKHGSSVFSGSLVAAMAPLPTLRNSLSLSANRTQTDESTTDFGSIFLSNTAAWYPGVSTSLTGGRTLSASDTGTGNETTTITFGASVIPHRALHLSMNYSHTETKSRQADREGADSFARRASAGMSYNPVSTLYFNGSLEQIWGTDIERRTFQNYSVSWAVQQGGGALELQFSYNENIDPVEDTRTRQISPGLTWKMNPRTVIDVVYTVTKAEFPAVTTESTNFLTSLRIRI